ncbi:MAG: DUF4177 domain-containing protein [Candidatus Hydrogenedens sp.]|nr:DUF4177 domain-containing protein [Candidatus Hydrogenedens sp.]
MAKFEYKIVSCKVEEGLPDETHIEPILNHLGSEGWELAAVTPVLCEGTTTYLSHHLRRLAAPARTAGFSAGSRSSED